MANTQDLKDIGFRVNLLSGTYIVSKDISILYRTDEEIYPHSPIDWDGFVLKEGELINKIEISSIEELSKLIKILSSNNFVRVYVQCPSCKDGDHPYITLNIRHKKTEDHVEFGRHRVIYEVPTAILGGMTLAQWVESMECRKCGNETLKELV